jgi:Outer membrane receptor proteins, mostly Fe transport
MRRLRNLVSSAALLTGMLLLFAVGAVAQVSTASITGTVTDPAGAVIPGAQIVLTNVATNVELRTQTNETGLYRFQNVTIGRYTLSASAEGFGTRRLEPFNLQVGQLATMDFVLTVGAVSETVTVAAAAAQVQSSSAELGTVIEQKQVVDLPLNGRSFTQMLLLQPGVNVAGISGSQSLSYTRGLVGQTVYNPSVNGQNNRANMYLLDGIVNIETFGNAYAIPPIVDAIEEFKVQSHNDSSDIGMSTGGTINVATKSGTNEFHGSAFEFLKNNALNARNSFLPTVPAFKANQFGAVAGGPVYIPKVYNGRNRTFVFGGYEGFRYRQPAFSYFNVPTEAMLQGDFSKDLNGEISTRQIFDPVSTAIGPDGVSYVRTPFPGNVIPASRLDPTMLYYMQTTVPKPIDTGRRDFNQVNATTGTQRQDSFTVRGDHVISEKDQVWFRYSGLYQWRYNPQRVGVDSYNNMFAHNYGTSWNHTFGPTSVLQVQFGRSKVRLPDEARYTNLPADFGSKMGLGPGLTEYTTGGVTLYPGVSISNWFSGGDNHTVNRPGDNWQIKGNYSKIVGNHTLRMGGEFIRADMGMVINYHTVSFREYETADPNNSANTGNSIASALLNVPFSSTRRDLLESLRFGGSMGLYISDSWKATQRLTINIGLRYDYTWIPPFGRVEDNNIYTGNMNTDTGEYWVLKVPGPCSQLGKAPCIPTPDGKLPENVIEAPGGTIMRGSPYMFGPRLGIAYRATQKTAIRTSFGIFYDSWAGVYQSARGIGGNWPMVATTMYTNLNNPTPSDLFPGVKMQTEWLGATNLPPELPWQMNWWYMDPEWKNGYSLQWNFGIQHQVAQNTVLSVDYVGSGGRRLDLGAARNTAVVPGPGDPRDRMRFPYMKPTYFAKSIGRNNYNAFQLSLKRSFSNGLMFITNYTWSKSIDIACSGFFGTEGCAVQNEYDLNGSRSVSSYDVPHNFVGSFIYELPFGRGKWLATNNKVADYIIGGWQVNGILQLRSGLPFHVSIPGDIANVGNPNTYMRPNVVGDWRLDKRTPERWFNTEAFATPPQFTYGNAGRNIMRQDWTRNLDFSLFRRFPINEQVRFELRAEAFGATNTPIFNIPDANMASPFFGQVRGSTGNRVVQLAGKVVW